MTTIPYLKPFSFSFELLLTRTCRYSLSINPAERSRTSSPCHKICGVSCSTSVCQTLLLHFHHLNDETIPEKSFGFKQARACWVARTAEGYIPSLVLVLQFDSLRRGFQTMLLHNLIYLTELYHPQSLSLRQSNTC